MSSVRHAGGRPSVDDYTPIALHPEHDLSKNSFHSEPITPSTPRLPSHTMSPSRSTPAELSPLHNSHAKYDAERAQDIPGLSYDARQSKSRSSSWDVLSGTVKRSEHAYEEIDSSRNGRNAPPEFAEGDMPNNKVSPITVHNVTFQTRYCIKITKFYIYLLHASIVTRWMLFIIPFLAILWIPGILSLTTYPHANVRPVSPFDYTPSNMTCRSGVSN